MEKKNVQNDGLHKNKIKSRDLNKSLVPSKIRE